MRKIKVLHLELDEHLGGIESFLYNLYSNIDRGQVQFDFVSRSSHPAKGLELETLGAKCYVVSSYKHLIRYTRDLKRVLENGYDVVHFHKNSAAMILPIIFVKMFSKSKIFIHSHNSQPSKGRITSLLHRVNRPILSLLVDKRFACSVVAGNWMYGNKKDFEVIKNGITVDNFKFSEIDRKNKREELSVKDDEFLVGHIGRFTEQKNHSRLIDIFMSYLDINSKAKLLLIGDGELKQETENKVNKLGLAGSVFFLGIRNDISDIVKAMDCFLMPSLYEGLPVVAIEAQCSGVNLVLSDTISPETDITGNVVWFSLNDDNDDIAKQICSNYSDKREEAYYSTIENGYDMRKSAELMLERYKNSYSNKEGL